ncbi:unnamed protein product [Protopolystoma xenopodis]|uniref:Uncharacterized protein n=1 Tax=Protopolystoma xenopodis TaxID=117903 RepID=A0A448XFB0_9PLAT|nr:unnamed protein product [Protopolystoma xenopodis]
MMSVGITVDGHTTTSRLGGARAFSLSSPSHLAESLLNSSPGRQEPRFSEITRKTRASTSSHFGQQKCLFRKPQMTEGKPSLLSIRLRRQESVGLIHSVTQETVLPSCRLFVSDPSEIYLSNWPSSRH